MASWNDKACSAQMRLLELPSQPLPLGNNSMGSVNLNCDWLTTKLHELLRFTFRKVLQSDARGPQRQSSRNF